MRRLSERSALVVIAALLLPACGDPASSDVSSGAREREVAAPAAQRVRVAEVRRGSLDGLAGVVLAFFLHRRRAGPRALEPPEAEASAA